MAKRKDSFSRALVDAKTRLTKCHAQREATRKLLTTLDIEIPLLQHTVAALERQVNPKGCYGPPTLEEVREVLHGYSVLNKPFVANEPTEEDLLPEPEGTPVVPEE